MAAAASTFRPPARPAQAARPALTIRPLSQPVGLPAGFEEEAWSRLQRVIAAVFEQGQLPRGLLTQEEAYRLVEAVCTNGCASSLFQRLQGECQTRVRASLARFAGAGVLGSSSKLGSNVGVGAGAGAGLGERRPLLGFMGQAWVDYCSALRQLCRIFMHLDRSHVSSQGCTGGGGARSLHECGLQLFRSCLESQPGLQEGVTQGILELVNEERAGGLSARPLLCSLVSMLSKLGVYAEVFEARLLDSAASFYRNESASLVASMSVAEYLLHCDRRLAEERARCSEAFQAETESSLLIVVHAELIKDHSQHLLDCGFGALVDDHQVADIARLCRLLGEVEELPALRKAWTHAIKRIGSAILADTEVPEKSKAVVPALMQLQARLQELLADAFGGNTTFAIALRDAFQDFLNSGAQQNLPAKLLARYVDEALRNETACSDEEMELALGKVLGIFRYISTKDAFEAFFKKDLAKRLLQQRSSSDAGEASILQKLRDECGQGYTSKIEGMVRDIELSKATLGTFTSLAATRTVLADSGLDLEVAVLTSGLWPAQPVASEVLFPSVPARLQDMYAAFYGAQHSGRSLKWVPLLGQCTLRATYEGAVRKELVMSHLQAITMLLFNGAERLTCAEIAAATRIPKADLHRTLQSLSLHKTVKVLLKASRSRDIDDLEVFTVNAGFSHKSYRIVVSQISAKEQQEEEAGVEQRLFEDRQHEVDAAIVRCMKASKKLSHQELLAKVFAAANFPVTAADVKKRIESLIEREYLERDPANASYTYLA